ncbi:hypothetical protein NEOKW01_0104 [Nematocida sp. AWRm80]|nr:hypothetical protein NEOKW01_0104 [Nematocida sp. AWRm80]
MEECIIENGIVLRVNRTVYTMIIDKNTTLEDITKYILSSCLMDKNVKQIYLYYKDSLLSSGIPMEIFNDVNVFPIIEVLTEKKQETPEPEILPQENKKINMPESTEEMKANNENIQKNTIEKEVSEKENINKEEHPSQPEETSRIRVKDRNGNIFLVSKEKVITIGNKTYLLRKKRESKLQELLSKLPNLSTILTYLVITTVFTLYMNKIFLIIMATFGILYYIEKGVRLMVVFNGNSIFSNALKQIMCFFATLILNPGHTLTLQYTEEQ